MYPLSADRQAAEAEPSDGAKSRGTARRARLRSVHALPARSVRRARAARAEPSARHRFSYDVLVVSFVFELFFGVSPTGIIIRRVSGSKIRERTRELVQNELNAVRLTFLVSNYIGIVRGVVARARRIAVAVSRSPARSTVCSVGVAVEHKGVGTDKTIPITILEYYSV